MDYLSSAPDLIIHFIFSYLTEPEISRLSCISRLFQLKATEHFESLCLKLNLVTLSPISKFGSLYSQRVKIIENWDTDSPSVQYFPFNLVKSVKFGSDFFVVLRFDGSLHSNISGSLEQLDTQVDKIDACMQGFIMQKWTNEVIWVRKNLEGLVSKVWTGEVPTAIAASLYGTVGLPSSKVVVFDRDYQREVTISEENPGKIVEIRSTPKMLLILTENKNLYLCGLITFDAIPVLTSKVRFFTIGNSHSLALLQEAISPFETWNTSELMKFMSKNGFEDCCQLIKNHEIDGKDLKELSDKYFIETLGIRETDRRIKLRYLLKQSNASSFAKTFSVLAWGRNNFSQIGPDINSVNTPTRIIQPVLTDDDSVKDVQSDKKHSYIITDKGKVLALGGKQTNKLTKAERKTITWEDVSKTLLDKGKIVEVQTSTSFVGVIYRPESKNQVKVKMRMAEDIVKLIVNGFLPLEQYEVGYLDRFLGMLEIGLTEFVRTDVPKHRIQYFKRNGKIVWDRRTRIDNF